MNTWAVRSKAVMDIERKANPARPCCVGCNRSGSIVTSEYSSRVLDKNNQFRPSGSDTWDKTRYPFIRKYTEVVFMMIGAKASTKPSKAGGTVSTKKLINLNRGGCSRFVVSLTTIQ
mmetsp:Transcript_24363/g.54489  ORF Transcript_24363/g.54489 Transcript_24363/m.54489 type:complete len:117 (+) Transcript_24363:1987-2337(+)